MLKMISQLSEQLLYSYFGASQAYDSNRSANHVNWCLMGHILGSHIEHKTTCLYTLQERSVSIPELHNCVCFSFSGQQSIE